MPRNKEFDGISKTRSALCKKKHYSIAAVGVNTTPSLKEKSKMGYEILPYEPTFSLPEIEKLGFVYKVLKNHNLYAFDPKGYSPHSLFEIDTAVETLLTEWDNSGTTDIKFEYVEADEQCINIDNRLNHDFPGCLFYDNFMHSNDFETYLAGFALMDEFLGVCFWYQFDDDNLIDFLRIEASEPCSDDPITEDSILPVDPDRWGESERDVFIYNGSKSLTISDIYKDYIKTISVKDDLIAKFDEVWNKISIKYLTELLKKRTAAAAWLNGVMYLVANNFHITDYSLYPDNDEDGMYAPLHTSYAVYHKYNDWFSFYDGFQDWQDQESPALRTSYFVDRIVKPKPDIDHQRIFKIFSSLFKINPVKGLFNEDKKHQIRTMLRHLPLHERERAVLCRRIKRAKKGRMGVHKSTV